MHLESNMRGGEEIKSTEQTICKEYNRENSLQTGELKAQYPSRSIPSPNSEMSSVAVAMLKLSESMPGLVQSTSANNDYTSVNYSTNGFHGDQNGNASAHQNDQLHRRERAFVPEVKKDDHYWVKRKKNNEAAKKSREKRRAQDKLLAQQVMELNTELDEVKHELEQVKRHFGYPVDLKFDPHVISVMNKNVTTTPFSMSRHPERKDSFTEQNMNQSPLPKPVALMPSISNGCLPMIDSNSAQNNSTIGAPILLAPTVASTLASHDSDIPYVVPPSKQPRLLTTDCMNIVRSSPSIEQEGCRNSPYEICPSYEAQYVLEAKTDNGIRRSFSLEHKNGPKTQQVNDINCSSTVHSVNSPNEAQAFDYTSRALSSSANVSRKRRHSNDPAHTNNDASMLDYAKQTRAQDVDSSSDEMSMTSQLSVMEGSEVNLSQRKGIPHKLRHKYNSIPGASQDKVHHEEITNNRRASSDTEQEVPLNMVIHDHNSRASSHSDSENSSSVGDSSECDHHVSSYKERRQRNNEASRKCRRNKRMEQTIQKEIANGLQEENSKLKGQMQYLSNEVHFLKELIYQRIEAQRKGVKFETPASLLEKVKNIGESNSS